jgi:uncharacterized protein (DUF1330 family)
MGANLSAYFLAFLRIHDRATYEKYLEGTDAALEEYCGQVLAVDDAPLALEGTPPGGRAVIIRFADEAALRRWYDSPAYRSILPYRLAAAEGEALAVHGR